jgi:hypothetical protein
VRLPLVDKRDLEKVCTTLEAIQIKRQVTMAKVIDNYRHTNTCIAVIPSDKTCVEFYRIENWQVQ